MHRLLLYAGALKLNLCCPAQLMPACATYVQIRTMCTLLHKLSCLQCKCTAGTASQLRRLRSSHPGLLMHAVHDLGKCSSDLPYLMPMLCVSTAGTCFACRWAPTPFL